MEIEAKGELFFDDSRLPICLDSYCAFIDVLGFSKQIRDAHLSAETDALLNSIFQSLTSAAEYLEVFKPGNQWNYSFFSDNLVLGFPCSGPDLGAEVELRRMLDQVAFYQMQLALDGFFTRGGLAVGGLHMSKNLIFGVSLLEAYELESQKALVPRIVLHKSVLRRINDQIHQHHSLRPDPFINQVLVDPDGFVFVNYLSALIIDSENFCHQDLIRHAQKISDCLLTWKGEEAILSKYQWLAEYHNYFCSEFARIPAEHNLISVDSLKVPNVVPRSFERLG